MADKSVGELIAAQSVTPTDLFVLEQNGTAKKLTGQILENWLVSFADGHGGISSVDKVGTSGLVDTYRITLADTTTFDFVVTNGRSINSIDKTSTSGLVDTYTISYNNGTTSTFTVKNGEKGDKGDNSYVWIKYASQEPTESSHSIGDIPDNWIGIYSGNASTAPTDWKQYKWFKHKGEKGDTGVAATLVNKSVTYQVSDSGTIIPSGAWSESVPVVAQGKFLWTKTETQFNTGEPIISYSVARMGIDGTGSVSSVAGVSPDSNGNVTLTAADVGALAVSGGDLTGELRMNGQPISGLNEPTEGTQAVPKSYVDKRVPLDGSQAMGGNLAMGGNRITGLAEPEDDGDAATKGYADTKASLPKTASGTVIALSDASSGPLQGLRVYGKTTQDGTPTPEAPVELVSVGDGGSVGVTIAGKNLIDLDKTPQEKTGDGVTYKKNSDGSYSRTGTATDIYGNIWLLGAYMVPTVLFTLLPGKKYFIRDCMLFVTNSGISYGPGIHTFKNEIEISGVRNDKLEKGKTYDDVVYPMVSLIDSEWEGIVPNQTLPISTPNGLPGIPVASGGNYTDASGQQWICDEVDFARGVYVQRVFYRAYNGSENWALSERNADKGQNGVFHLGISSAILAGKEAWNSRFKKSSWAATGSGVFDTLYGQIRCNAISTDMTVAEWKSLLAQWAADGAPMRFMAQLATPTETPIPADELAAYAAMHTNKPNTTIYSDAGAHMDVGYYPPDATMRQEDIKGYVDSKLKFGGVSMANSVVMEYSLGTSFTDEQSADIRSGKFEKVHVGGYWTINGRKYWAAHADYRLHCGDTELTTHHMLVIPDKPFYNGVMNDTNDTTGSYYGSKMKTSGLADALATVKADFGMDHILTHRILLANAVSNGVSSGWAWYDSQIDLMNEKMVYGSHAGGGGSQNGYDTGADKSQLALFQARPDLITNRKDWWQRDVQSAPGFCCVRGDGNNSSAGASNSLGVRPAFLIY